MAPTAGAKTDGIWAPHTATIDWCEANYEVTEYIAEFWNTVSNLVMILLPIYGIYWSWYHSKFAQQHSTRSRPLFEVPTSIVLCNIGLVLVGVGSWLFHMTLLYPAQLLDEIPMIFGSALLIYANYDILMQSVAMERGANWKPKTFVQKFLRSKLSVFALIAAYCAAFVYVYLFVWKNPIFHEIAYALMVFVIIAENVTLIRRYKLKKRLYLISFIYYMFGFLLWNLDNKFCSYLQHYRSQVETLLHIQTAPEWQKILLNCLIVSLKSISEFHSLWHIFTGYAAFMTILFLIEVHFKHYSLVHGKTHYKPHQKPVESKLCSMYYHLSDSLLIDKQAETAPRQQPKRGVKSPTKKYY